MLSSGKQIVLLVLVLLTGTGIWLGGFDISSGITSGVAKVSTPGSQASAYRHQRTVQYSISIRNPTNSLFEGVELFAHAPVRLTSVQQCCERLVTSHPYTLESDHLGNQLMRFHIEKLAPYASEIVSIRADMRLAEEAQTGKGVSLPDYLGEERYVQVNDPVVRERAEALLVRGDPVASAKNVHEWVAKNVTDSGYNQSARGALYALQNQRGDCTESMHLFMALSRASDVPSRGIAGYVYDRNAVLSPREYHNWAEFYDGDAWRIADPHRKVFMKNENHYIAMQIMTEDDPEGAGSAQYWVNTEGLEVRMN